MLKSHLRVVFALVPGVSLGALACGSDGGSKNPDTSMSASDTSTGPSTSGNGSTGNDTSGTGGSTGTNSSTATATTQTLISEGFSCTTELWCVESASAEVFTSEEFDQEQSRCTSNEGQFQTGGTCASVEAFATCMEADRITHHTMIERGSSLDQMEDRCVRREGTWQLDPLVDPVAELSVDDLTEIDVSPSLAPEIVPLHELNNYCSTSEDTFGIGVTSNDATGFTRYHYFACVGGKSWFNQYHFTQLLRDSYDTLEDFPSPGTYARVFSIGESLFFVTGSSCWNCSYSFGAASGTLLTVTDAGTLDGSYQATVTDAAGDSMIITLVATAP